MKRKRGQGQLVIYGKRKRHKAMTKYVKKIAKSVVLRTFETKNNTFSFSTSFYGNGGLSSPGDCYFYNITRGFFLGDGDQNMQGNKVVIKSLRAQCVADNITSANAPQGSCTFRITLVATDQQIGWSLNPGSATNYGFVETTTANGTLNWFNPRTMTVIKDRKVQVHPDLTSAGTKRVQFTFNKYWKKGLGIEFITTPTSGGDNYLKRKNYYLVICACKPDATNGLYVQMDLAANVKIDYKDV